MTKVNLKILKSGYCIGNKNKTLTNANSEIQKFYAGFVLIDHPEIGKILFDTGYSDVLLRNAVLGQTASPC